MYVASVSKLSLTCINLRTKLLKQLSFYTLSLERKQNNQEFQDSVCRKTIVSIMNPESNNLFSRTKLFIIPGIRVRARVRTTQKLKYWQLNQLTPPTAKKKKNTVI